MGIENKELTISLDDILAYSYLYVPILVFLLGWIRPYLAYPACTLLLLCTFSGLHKKQIIIGNVFTQKSQIALLLFSLLLLLWCILSGQGGLVLQPGDWNKHNTILSDLINYDWPVRYSFQGMHGTMSYYIGAYLLPALTGKIAGKFEAAEWCLLVWCWLGLFLTGIKCWNYIDGKRRWKLLAVGMCMILFSTFISPLTTLYGYLIPGDCGDGVHWMSASIRIQYSSNIILLRWVFPQTIPAWLTSIMLLERRKDIRSWGLTCVPLILYSTFAFIGIVIIALFWGLVDYKKSGKSINRVGYIKDLFSSHNLAALFVLAVLSAYLSGNILQPKPSEAAMGLTQIDYTHYKTLFVLFHLSWGIWIALLFWKEGKQELLYTIVISLFLFPFVSLGTYNDLCMRASIPALFLLCILVMRQLLSEKSRKAYRLLLLCALLISSTKSCKELYRAVTQGGIHAGNHCTPYHNLTELMEEFTPATYQYVDWNVENGINQWIVRKE